MAQPDPTTLFRSLISLCGLTQAQAADLLDRGHETIRQKATGHKPVVSRDLEILRDLWLQIDRGDRSLTQGPSEHAAAIRWARSVSTTDTSGDDA